MRNKILYIILLLVLLVIIIVCKPINTEPPAYIKNIAVYKEGYDAIAVYFILADSSGAMTASDGLVALEISLKRKGSLEWETRPSKSFNDELMNRLLEKEAEWDSLHKKSFDETWKEVVSSAKAMVAGKRSVDDPAIAKRRAKYDEQASAAADSIGDLEKQIINRYKASRTQIPKEYLPLGFSTTIYINFFDVKSKDFKKTKVGVGAFEREALVYLVGRLPFSELAPYYNSDDTGILEIKFETKDGKVLQGEESFYFK